MFHKDRGRSRLLLKDIERERDQLIAVALRKIRDGADQAGSRAAQFGARFTQRILAHHGALLRCAGFLKSAQGGERANVVHSSNKRAARPSAAQVFTQNVEHLLKVAAAVEPYQWGLDNPRQLSA